MFHSSSYSEFQTIQQSTSLAHQSYGVGLLAGRHRQDVRRMVELERPNARHNVHDALPRLDFLRGPREDDVGVVDVHDARAVADGQQPTVRAEAERRALQRAEVGDAAHAGQRVRVDNVDQATGCVNRTNTCTYKNFFNSTF